MMLRVILILILSFSALCASAQTIKSVTIRVHGLHCSACSFAVDHMISNLDFVESSVTSLNKRKVQVTFNENDIDVFELAKAVRNAGFSVGYIDLHVEDFTLKGENFKFANASNDFVVEENTGNDYRILHKGFISKEYISKPEWKRIKKRKKSSQLLITSVE